MDVILNNKKNYIFKCRLFNLFQIAVPTEEAQKLDAAKKTGGEGSEVGFLRVQEYI